MPEQVYRDLTPGLSDVPAETWAGATAEGVRDILESQSIHPNPHELGLRALADSVRIRPVTDAARGLLTELSPELLATYDAYYARQQQLHFRIYGENYTHPNQAQAF